MTTAMILTKANRLYLDKFNSLAIDGKHGWAPVWSGSVKDLAEALEDYAGDEVVVSFKTYSDETLAGDKRKYSKRIESLSPAFTFSGWTNLVIDGHVFQHKFVGVLSRAT